VFTDLKCNASAITRKQGRWFRGCKGLLK